MKKLLLIICLMLTLSACGQKPAPAAPVEKPAEAPVEVPAEEPEKEPAAPAASPEAPETAVVKPEVPAEQPVRPALPPLPQPVYCYGDTAVDSKGAVLFQVPEHQLAVIYDHVTGLPRGFAAIADHSRAITAIYDLTGAPILENLQASQCGWLGDLVYYGDDHDYTVCCVSEELVLYEGMAAVVPVGADLLVEHVFWNSSCTLLDGSGQVVRELERSFRFRHLLEDRGQLYLVMEARDGTQTLIDPQGSTYLGRFYDEIADLSDGRALVRDGSTWMAVELGSGTVLYRSSTPFTLLPGAMLLAGPEPGQQLLTDAAGQPLADRPLTDARLLETEDAVVLASKEIRDGAHAMAIRDLQGQELLALPDEATNLALVNDKLLFAALPTGAGAFVQSGSLYNLETGEVLPLLDAKFLTARTAKTSQGPVILCTGQKDNGDPLLRAFWSDGTELLPDESLQFYHGGDVFAADRGLLCLDGTPLFEP